MTKAELIERIARSRDLPPDISKKLIGQILGVAFDELASYFARARVTRSQSPRFTFPRFGTFTKKRRSARRGVNPRTLEPIQIEACNTIDFKASRELREAMNPTLRNGEGGELGDVGTWASAGEPPEATAPSASKPAASASATTSKKKTKARKTKTTRTRDGAAAGKRAAGLVVVGPGKRRLTPRDDDPELTAFGEAGSRSASDARSGTELPASPMQRASGKRRTRSRGTG